MKYVVQIYGGRTWCGNAYCETIDECIEFAKSEGSDEGLITKAVIVDMESHAKMTVKFEVKK